MNVEHSRPSSGLEYIPSNNDGLDEFDAEPEALVPRRVQRRTEPDNLLRCENETSEITLLPSRVDLDPGELPLMERDTSLFAVIEAGPGLHRQQVPSPVAPRFASVMLLAVLFAGVLLIGTGTLPSPYTVRPSVPSALEARHIADVDTLALSPAPDIAAAAVAAENNIPVVYQKPSTPADPPVVTTIDGGMDIETVRRAFEGLRGQNLDFQHCDVRLASADRAVARCRGTLGDLSAWTMDLNRAGEQWRVVSLEASRPPG
jgi:hypothetical protein